MMSKNTDPKSSEAEDTCFHSYKEHLKRLQGGDFQTSNLRENKYLLKYPSGRELAAFLDIGAEAERKNEVQFQEMKSCIDKLSGDNDFLRKELLIKSESAKLFHKRITEKDKAILSLTAEVELLNCKMKESRHYQNLRPGYNGEKERLVKENDDLTCEVKQLKWKILKLVEEHGSGQNKDLENMECKIRQLSELLKEKETQLQNSTCKLKELKDGRCELEKKITSLEDQLQSQYDEFNSKSCTYQKQIEDLESQITFMEQSLMAGQSIKLRYGSFISKLKAGLDEIYKKSQHTLKESDCQIENQIYNEILNQQTSTQESYNAQQMCERDRILQELMAKIELRDGNLQQLSRIRSSNCSVTHKDYQQLVRLIDEQSYEIERMTQDLQELSLEDTNSTELLSEVNDIQNAVCDATGGCNESGPLSRRIQRLRCKIKSRLQREEARRQEMARQLGIYRCQFVTLQKEIDELRKENSPNCKDGIRVRLEKEKALTQVINQLNKHKREFNMKCNSLTKALTNLEKVSELLKHLSKC